MPTTVDTDTLSVGGHGTHVNGIVAGNPVTLTGGKQLQGAAPGAKLVSLSTGAGLFIIGADAALNWVLENHAAPCGAGVPAAECPPIKVTNNSYGPSGGGEFDPESATVKLQRALAAEGVVTVWANGNDGGDGSHEPVQPARHGPDRRHHLGGVLLRPGHRHPRRRRVRLQLARRGRRPVDVPRHLRTRREHHLVVPPLPGDLRDRASPRRTARACSTSARSTRSAARRWRRRTSPASWRSSSRPTRPRPPPQVEAALKTTAHKYADGAAYEQGPLGTTSFDKGYGLVDVVAAAQAVR